MQIDVSGNVIEISIPANELSSNDVVAHLPDGYSYRKIFTITSTNVNSIQKGILSTSGRIYHFPVVNGSSPCTFKLRISDVKKFAYIAILIEKFGQKPDIHYFDTAFEPILVTGKDGEEYNMIPSDQFK